MRNFKRKWTLDRTKYMTAPEVTELRRTIESKAKEDLEHGRTTWPRFWMALDLALGAGLRVLKSPPYGSGTFTSTKGNHDSG